MTIFIWASQALTFWFAAGIIGGILILVAERLSRRDEPSDADVRRTAERYRRHYGARALIAIGDHGLASRFVPDGRHGRFLARVAAELRSQATRDEDRRGAGEPWDRSGFGL